MPIACGTSELWHGLQGIVAASLGEAKELPMPLRGSWDLCRLQGCWLCSGCWGTPSQGGRWGAADSWDLRDMLVTGKTEEMVIWEEILGLFCFDSWLDMGWSESDQGEVHTWSFSSCEWMEREIRERRRSRWRKFGRFLKLLIHPVKTFCLVSHLHLEVFKQNPGEKESFNTIKNK